MRICMSRIALTLSSVHRPILFAGLGACIASVDFSRVHSIDSGCPFSSDCTKTGMLMISCHSANFQAYNFFGVEYGTGCEFCSWWQALPILIMMNRVSAAVR